MGVEMNFQTSFFLENQSNKLFSEEKLYGEVPLALLWLNLCVFLRHLSFFNCFLFIFFCNIDLAYW